MTIWEVADYRWVTERSMYRLASAKKSPSFEVVKSWQLSKIDMDEWIKGQSQDDDVLDRDGYAQIRGS